MSIRTRRQELAGSEEKHKYVGQSHYTLPDLSSCVKKNLTYRGKLQAWFWGLKRELIKESRITGFRSTQKIQEVSGKAQNTLGIPLK